MNTSAQLLSALAQESDVMKKAELARKLYRDVELPVKAIASSIKKHPSYVSHLLRLSKIPQIVLDGYYGKLISATHLMLISRLDTEQEIIDAYEEVLKKNMTVSQTETLIRKLRYDVTDDNSEINLDRLDRWQEELRDSLEAKVSILQTRVRTKIVIEKRGKPSDTTAFITEIVTKLQQELDDKSEEELTVIE